MSGRRSHPRFGVSEPWGGAIRVLRDVVVNRSDADELLAVSHLAGVVGEQLSLDLLGGGSSLELKVEVLDSRPVIVNGTVRHRLRLGMVSAVADDKQPERAAPEAPAPGSGFAVAEAN
jgi:hypothetical protein